MSPQAHTPSRSSFPVVLAVVALFLLFWFLTSKVYIDEPAATTTSTVDRPSLVEHRGKAQTLLQNYSVIDAANGKVRLPIERAMELVIAENANSEDAIGAK